MAQKAIVGEKVGMTQVWGDDQRVIPVTVLRVEPARIVQVKTNERDGYSAVQVTFGTKNARKIFASTQSMVSKLVRKSPSTHLLLARKSMSRLSVEAKVLRVA